MILNIQSEKEKINLTVLCLKTEKFQEKKMRERQNGVDSYFFAIPRRYDKTCRTTRCVLKILWYNISKHYNKKINDTFLTGVDMLKREYEAQILKIT